MNSYLPEVEKLEQGHPLQVYYQESALIQDLILELYDVKVSEDFQKYFNIFKQLKTIEKRFKRKENQLFPYLEKHHCNCTSQWMWSFIAVFIMQLRLLIIHYDNTDLEKLHYNCHS